MGTVIAHVARVDRRTLQQIEQVGVGRVGLGQVPDESKPVKLVRREVDEQTPSNQRATAPPCIPPMQPPILWERHYGNDASIGLFQKSLDIKS